MPLTFEGFQELFKATIAKPGFLGWKKNQTPDWITYRTLDEYLTDTNNKEQSLEAQAWALTYVADQINLKGDKDPQAGQWQYWLATLIYGGCIKDIRLTQVGPKEQQETMISIQAQLTLPFAQKSANNDELAMFWAYQATINKNVWGLVFLVELNQHNPKLLNEMGKKFYGDRWGGEPGSHDGFVNESLKIAAKETQNAIAEYLWGMELYNQSKVHTHNADYSKLKRAVNFLIKSAKQGYNSKPFFIAICCYRLAEHYNEKNKDKESSSEMNRSQSKCVKYLVSTYTQKGAEELEASYALLLLGICTKKNYKTDYKLGSEDTHYQNAIKKNSHFAEAYFYLAEFYLNEAQKSWLTRKGNKDQNISNAIQCFVKAGVILQAIDDGIAVGEKVYIKRKETILSNIEEYLKFINSKYGNCQKEIEFERKKFSEERAKILFEIRKKQEPEKQEKQQEGFQEMAQVNLETQQKINQFKQHIVNNQKEIKDHTMELRDKENKDILPNSPKPPPYSLPYSPPVSPSRPTGSNFMAANLNTNPPPANFNTYGNPYYSNQNPYNFYPSAPPPSAQISPQIGAIQSNPQNYQNIQGGSNTSPPPNNSLGFVP